MCGIFGIWKLAETGYDFLPLIKKLMEESKVRGTDATGVAFLAHKEGVERSLFFHKLPMKPQEYAKEVAEKIIPKDFKAIIVHTRHATQGDPKVNNNNHPFVAGGIPFAFIHNGIISSKYTGRREKPAETDSVELFCEIWDEIEKAPGPENRIAAVKAGMEKHEGSATIAVLFSECIVLGKHSNPCWLAYVPEKKCIIFASTDTMLEHALDCILEPFYGIFRPYNITEMKNDTILKIDDTGVVLGGELNTRLRLTHGARAARSITIHAARPLPRRVRRASGIGREGGGTTTRRRRGGGNVWHPDDHYHRACGRASEVGGRRSGRNSCRPSAWRPRGRPHRLEPEVPGGLRGRRGRRLGHLRKEQA
jgi:glucosamine--fructose-6-phosphate aminotransferase (isomerizing)